VQPGPDELGRVYAADLPILAGMAEFCAAAAALPAAPDLPWADQARTAHAEWITWNTPPTGADPNALPSMDELMGLLRKRLPADAIITNGAGNFSIWVHRYLRWNQFGTQLGPTNGSMGYGVPAAIAAAVQYPERCVLAFSGDGCFLMNGQEMATAVRERARIRVIVVDNGMYGTIRMHQEKRFPGRVFGSALGQPDFAMLARAYGAWGARVEQGHALAGLLDEMLAVDGPALLHLVVDPQIITPTTTIDGMRRAHSA
jgi:acetolactate synthase-1/2/3 large subunit